jgi:hypothetical protein
MYLIQTFFSFTDACYGTTCICDRAAATEKDERQLFHDPVFYNTTAPLPRAA